MKNKILIVGSGLFGSICAHELLKSGYHCYVIDKRPHIGGNCFTRYNEHARCNEHVYGPHVFHTDSEQIWNYINQFAPFISFKNRVKVKFENEIYSFPINLRTLYQVFGVSDPQSAKNKLELSRIPIDNPANFEEYCLAEMGETLYRMFFRGYTQKQWNTDPRNLSVEIAKRIPIRLNFDDAYYDDRYQGIPVGGYTQIFEKLLEGIPFDTNVDFLSDRDYWLSNYEHIIYTGPIDAFFDYEFGELGYRSLRFETELLEVSDFQGNPVINYTEHHVPWTRITEHKHFDQDYSAAKTLITKEYPQDWLPRLEPFYPINNSRNEDILKKYQELSRALSAKVYFRGRLGEYRYYNMDTVIGTAISFCRKFCQFDM